MIPVNTCIRYGACSVVVVLFFVVIATMRVGRIVRSPFAQRIIQCGATLCIPPIRSERTNSINFHAWSDISVFPIYNLLMTPIRIVPFTSIIPFIVFWGVAVAVSSNPALMHLTCQVSKRILTLVVNGRNLHS